MQKDKRNFIEIVLLYLNSVLYRNRYGGPAISLQLSSNPITVQFLVQTRLDSRLEVYKSFQERKIG